MGRRGIYDHLLRQHLSRRKYCEAARTEDYEFKARAPCHAIPSSSDARVRSHPLDANQNDSRALSCIVRPPTVVVVMFVGEPTNEFAPVSPLGSKVRFGSPKLG
jgi:hypothetical protein